MVPLLVIENVCVIHVADGVVTTAFNLTVRFVALLHVVPTQVYGAPLQSAAVVQLVLQAPVPHAYAMQLDVVAA